MSIFNIKKTPLRIQCDPLECGAVCLGIILQYFGRYESIQTLKERAQVSRMGSYAKNLISAATSFQLDAKAYRRSASDLKHINSLGILFFDRCHFVVFEGFFRGNYYINDPGFGRYALSEKAFRARYGGLIIEIAQGQSFQKNVARRSEAVLAKSFFYSIIALGILGGLLLALSLMLSGYLLANVVAQYSNIVAYFLLVLAVILCVNFAVFLPLWQRIIKTAKSSSEREEKIILANVARVSLDFFEDRPFAALKAAYAGTFIRQMAGWQAKVLRVFYLSMVVVLFFFLASLSRKIFLWAFFLCINFLLLKYLCNIKIAPIEFAKNNQRNKLSATQEKAFDMAKDMSAMGQNEKLVEPIIQAEMALLHEDLRKPAVFFLDKYLLAIFLVLFWLGFCLFASPFLKTNGFHLNELIASLLLGSFLFIIAHFYVVNLISTYWASPASFLLDLQEASLSAPRSTALSGHSLVLGSFSHSFAQSESPLFSNASVIIERGKIYGLVGAPLSGKSTLLKIIARKLRPSKNALNWLDGDDKPLKIGLIDTDSDVFLGTLRDNIALWDDKKTEEQIAHALSLACGEELFFNRPLGLLSPIYAQGGNISGGQKKRLMLARAMLVSPDLLILDNFFETLDSDRALAILNNIKNLNISCIFSSYNSDYLKIAHEVIFLSAGQILLGKSHEDLLKQSVDYQKLVSNPAA